MEKSTKNLKNLRMSVFLSQSEFANLLGVTSSYYNKLETGKSKPSSKLDKLIDYTITEKKKSLHGLDAETGRDNDRDSESDLKQHNPDPRHLELATRCMSHISRFAMQCLAENPNRLYWLEEELKQRFELTDSEPK